MNDINIKCKWHGCNKIAIRVFCSLSCRNKFNVDKRRKTLKTLSVEYLGGSCKRCGWKEHQCGLVPHHTNPHKKEYGISTSGNTKSWESLKLELDKCILLCSNCHFVVHTLNLTEWFDKEYVDSETKFKKVIVAESEEDENAWKLRVAKKRFRKNKPIEIKEVKPKSELEILLGFK